MANITDNQTYDRVFYCIYQNNDCVESQSPREIGRWEIHQYLVDVARKQKNFIGFIDKEQTTLQFYIEEVGKIWVDLPSPERGGSYGKHISNEQMGSIVNDLSEPYARYVEELELSFQKW